MLQIDRRIITFIKEHHLFTISSSVGDQPWAAHCFYTYMELENLFVFTSDLKTKHVSDFIKNPKAALSVALETDVIGKIQGLQVTGNVTRPEGRMLIKAKSRYLKRFPFAILMNTTIWVFLPEYMKMTDNRLGFGKKLVWEATGNVTNMEQK